MNVTGTPRACTPNAWQAFASSFAFPGSDRTSKTRT